MRASCLRKRAVFVLLALMAVAACSAPKLPAGAGDKTPGALELVEPLGRYSATTMRLLFWWGELPEPVRVTTGMRMYRLHYWTTSPEGSPTVASGLVALPKKGALRGVVSYQHGTTSNRHVSPSKPTLHEGVLGSALFAGAGYVFAAPDYIGLGVSREPHPYLHAASTASTTIDMLMATKTFVEAMGLTCPRNLYLVGFSQGGHATLAVQRALEALEAAPMRVKAAASAAGAYNLADITFPAVLEGKSSAHSLYLAWLVSAYCRIYKQPLDSMLASPYAEQVDTLFDGEHEPDAISAALPAKPRDMFRKEFLDAYDTKQSNWFFDALRQNEVFQWTPKAPVRLYYGDDDIDVPPQEAKAAAAEFVKRGADAKAISVGPYTHDVSIMHAVPKIRAWFDELAGEGE